MSDWSDRHDVMAHFAASAVVGLVAAVVAFAAWALVTVATEGVLAVMP